MKRIYRILSACALLQVGACGGPSAGPGAEDSGARENGGGDQAIDNADSSGSPAEDAGAGGADASTDVGADAGDGSRQGDADRPDGLAPPGADAGMDVGAVVGQLVCNPGTTGNGQSRLTTGDPPEWKLSAGAMAGKLTPKASFLSSTFGKHFPYVIYTSANYVMGQPATLLVFGDGGQYLSDFHAQTVLDNLTAAGTIPPTVGLFIDPPSDGDRVQTYDPPLDKYPTFLVSEIIPAVITGKYSVSNDPNAWVIIGYSASGGQGWNVVWKRPDNFHKFIGHSASVGAANVAMYGNVNWVDIVNMSPKHNLRVSLTTCDNDLTDNRGSWKTILTNLFNALTAKGNDTRLVVGPNGHSPPIDGERDFPTSLRWMFQGCSFAR
ncbi:MAG TPA: alpha/beta hydrolase-fold protein [Polyangia bacterium]|jgi:enterochelin esterase family protein|nr:alpha/beta hydrolase-fold protein [Polyangia bacterium]